MDPKLADFLKYAGMSLLSNAGRRSFNPGDIQGPGTSLLQGYQMADQQAGVRRKETAAEEAAKENLRRWELTHGLAGERLGLERERIDIARSDAEAARAKAEREAAGMAAASRQTNLLATMPRFDQGAMNNAGILDSGDELKNLPRSIAGSIVANQEASPGQVRLAEREIFPDTKTPAVWTIKDNEKGISFTVDANDPSFAKYLGDPRYSAFKTTVQTDDPDKVGGGFSQTPSQEGNLAESFAESAIAISDMTASYAALMDAGPGATGLVGAAFDLGAGIAEQLDGLAGTDAANYVFGSEEERNKITKARTMARTTVAKQLSTISGDESGRYTDREYDIARTTLKALDPKSGFKQVAEAYRTVQEIEWASASRQGHRLLRKNGMDLYSIGTGNAATDEDVDLLIRAQDMIMGSGYTLEQATEMTNRIIEMGSQ
jgi:hypothetical protein